MTCVHAPQTAQTALVLAIAYAGERMFMLRARVLGRPATP
jgi:hypothetical protein